MREKRHSIHDSIKSQHISQLRPEERGITCSSGAEKNNCQLWLQSGKAFLQRWKTNKGIWDKAKNLLLAHVLLNNG